MKTRHIPGIPGTSPGTSKACRRRASTCPARRGSARFLAERIPDARIVRAGEVADFIMMKPADLEELIEDAVAAALYRICRPAARRRKPGQAVARENRGLSLTALAEKAEIGKGYLSQIESGGRKGTVQTLLRLAAALNVDPRRSAS